MAVANLSPRTPHATHGPDAGTRTAVLVVDTESVPDGKLLSAVKYAGENLTMEEAVERAQAEARGQRGGDFVPVSFHVPVAACMVRVGPDFALLGFKCLDEPQFRPREIVNQFWFGVSHYHSRDGAKVVTFNGRGFDMPLMELSAFRYGVSAGDYFRASRNRFNGPIDLMDWLTNFGAGRLAGGLNLLAKMLGKPGKMGVSGEKVYRMYREGRLQEINDYCLCDALDTYFVFLRTRVLTGDLTPEQEAALVARARELLRAKSAEVPALARYLDHWAEAL
jgi:predicted PolB exonuclease-like 3'-5' exonuclease